MLDGEVVVPREIGGRIRLDWESLSASASTPPPAASRCSPKQTPAHFIGFDALATGDTSLLKEPFRVRGQALSEAVNEKQWCHVTRTTEDPEQGVQWLTTFEGAGLDGVIAKRLDGPYVPGKREMVKVKHARDADCVAIGYRIHKSGEGVGSILLGLYRDDGELQMVGGAASFTAKDRLKLLADLEPLREGDEPSTASRAGGTRPPTSAGSRCGRRRCARSPTTRWRETRCTASDSGTRSSSCGGGPTAIRRAAPSTSSTCR